MWILSVLNVVAKQRNQRTSSKGTNALVERTSAQELVQEKVTPENLGLQNNVPHAVINSILQAVIFHAHLVEVKQQRYHVRYAVWFLSNLHQRVVRLVL